MKSLNIVLVGVGGQGILTMARLLVEAAVARGLKALAAETHGMSQRGGSVIVHVRIGEQILSPLIPRGYADIVVGTELIETARYLVYASSSSTVLTNTKVITPPIPGIKSVDAGHVIEWIRSRVSRLLLVEASRIAEELGFPQSTNMVMLGALSRLVNEWIDIDYLEKAVAQIGRGRIAELNLEAFRRGADYICKRYSIC